MVNTAFPLDEDGNFQVHDPVEDGLTEAVLASGGQFLATVARIRLETERGTMFLHRSLGIEQSAFMVVDAAPVIQTLVVASLSQDPDIKLISRLEVSTEDGDSRVRQMRVLVGVSGEGGDTATVEV
jgi:hypothetical protein